MKKDKIIILILIIIFLILFARYLVVKQHIIQKIMYMMREIGLPLGLSIDQCFNPIPLFASFYQPNSANRF